MHPRPDRSSPSFLNQVIVPRKFLPFLNQVISNPTDVNRLICVGHSPGGAVAINVALRLLRSGYREAFCITFGAPLAVDRGVCDFLTATQWIHHFLCIIHKEDFIPLVLFLANEYFPQVLDF